MALDDSDGKLMDQIERAIENTVLEPPYCRAKSKTSGKRCKNRPLPGVTKCRYHGGNREGKPNPRAVKHGFHSKYVSVDVIPALIQRVEELRSREGKEEALLMGAAETERRLADVPVSVENLDVFTKARKSIREDLSVADELTRDQAPTHAPVIVVGNYEQAQVFQSRTLDGMVTIRVIDGEPYMRDDVTGDFLRAVKLVDEATGADYYTRALELPAAR